MLTIELFKWVGPAVKPALDGKIKPVQVSELPNQCSHYSQWSHVITLLVQMKELEEEFGKVTGGPPAPNRLLRSQQQAAAAAPVVVASEGDGGAVAAVSAAPAIDPFDLIDPTDFLGKMPKDFYERIVRTSPLLV